MVKALKESSGTQRARGRRHSRAESVQERSLSRSGLPSILRKGSVNVALTRRALQVRRHAYEGTKVTMAMG